MPPTKGFRVTLDKARTVRFTNRALWRLEEEAGWTVDQAAAMMQKGSTRAMTYLIWAGLLHAEPDLTVDAVVDRVQLHRLGEVMPVVAQALQSALSGEQEGKEAGNGE